MYVTRDLVENFRMRRDDHWHDFGETWRPIGGNRFIVELAKVFVARRWQDLDDRSQLKNEMSS